MRAFESVFIKVTDYPENQKLNSGTVAFLGTFQNFQK